MVAEASQGAHWLLIFCFAATFLLWNTANAATFLLERPSKGRNANLDQEASGRPQRPYPADKARGGKIVLRTPLQRWIFIAGLLGAVLLVLILSFFR
jgi:hypothetical protein